MGERVYASASGGDEGGGCCAERRAKRLAVEAEPEPVSSQRQAEVGRDESKTRDAPRSINTLSRSTEPNWLLPSGKQGRAEAQNFPCTYMYPLFSALLLMSVVKAAKERDEKKGHKRAMRCRARAIISLLSL